MSYSPVNVESFGGLNLVDDPGTVGWGGAIDVLNVDLDRHGRVRSRDGYIGPTTSFGAGVSGAGAVTGISPAYGSSTNFLLVAQTDAIKAFSGNYLSYASAPSTTNAFKGAYSFARSPANESIYVGNVNSSGNTVGRFRGSVPAFETSGTGTMPAYVGTAPTGKFVTTWPFAGGNRLVNANRWGTTAGDNGSTVRFSNTGTATTWSANDYVDLFPFDGESVTGLCAWRDQVFAFKGSRFFVFYGETPDASGNPVFSYRPIDVGIGNASPQGVAPGTGAVYFVNRRGIYRTTGGAPELISRQVDGVFTGSVPSFFQSSTLNQAAIAACSLFVANERLYFSYPSGSATANDRTLVFDLGSEAWTLWDTPMAAGTSFRLDTTGIDDVFFGTATPTGPFRINSTYTDDAGVAITSRYRSGFSDLGSPDLKTIREWRLQGTGAPTLKTSYDFGSLETGAAVTLGTSPATAGAPRRYATRGRQFSWQVGGTTAWSLNNIVADVREKRAPGVHAAA